MRWYRLSADQGHANAQFNLGLMFAKGEGVPKGDREAAKWYRKAAEQGHARAQSRLSVRYTRGEGVQADNIQALFWATLAAAQGEPLAVDYVRVMRRDMNSADVALAERRAAAWKAVPEG